MWIHFLTLYPDKYVEVQETHDLKEVRKFNYAGNQDCLKKCKQCKQISDRSGELDNQTTDLSRV